jgi:orotidine-5'-phosphate decarboxylase
MHFADTLTARIANTSAVCVELSPTLARLPSELPKTDAGMLAFCREAIDAVHAHAAAVSLQMGHFEMLGWEGMKVFWEACTYAKDKGLVVIADGKRSDIGSAAEAYADAYLFAGSPIDALTVQPYLGFDSIVPFIERCVKNEKGMYIVVKTNNASSGEIQDLPISDEAVHEYLAQLVESWGMHHLGTTNFSCVGALVGATYPEELKYLRTLMPHLPFLLPDFGAEGSIPADFAHGFVSDGTGAMVTVRLPQKFGAQWREEIAKAATHASHELAGVL